MMDMSVVATHVHHLAVHSPHVLAAIPHGVIPRGSEDSADGEEMEGVLATNFPKWVNSLFWRFYK